MKITSLPARLLTTDLVSRWHDILAATPELAGPYFRPEFIAVVAAERPRVEVAVLEDAGQIVGFFPFERSRWNVARPVGSCLSDYQGVIAARDMPWEPAEIMSACDLVAWEFDHQLAWQQQLLPSCAATAASPVIDVAHGFENWLECRKAAGGALKETLRKLRKLERESQSVTFEWHAQDTAAFRQLLRWKSAQYIRTGAPDLFRQRWIVALLERIRATQEPHFRGVLSVLRVDGRLLAVHLGMQAGNTLHSWFPAYDPEQSRCSPGQILLIKLAQEAAARGVTRIDLGKGSEDYKLVLASRSVEIAEGCLDRRPFAAGVRRGWSQARDWVKRSPLGSPVKSSVRWLRRIGEWVGDTALAASWNPTAAGQESARRFP
jgi:CelD/BcsL family acetyltransferase involved in cellulose biosynthesis